MSLLCHRDGRSFACPVRIICTLRTASFHASPSPFCGLCGFASTFSIQHLSAHIILCALSHIILVCSAYVSSSSLRLRPKESREAPQCRNFAHISIDSLNKAVCSVSSQVNQLCSTQNTNNLQLIQLNHCFRLL